MTKYWFEYVRSCYDLVVESEGITHEILNHEVEAHIVHLMAKNFHRTDIGEQPISLKVMEAINLRNRDVLIDIADECLLINSYPLRRSKWPTLTYYRDMGVICYGLADHFMEDHFNTATLVLASVFNRDKNNYKGDKT